MIQAADTMKDDTSRSGFATEELEEIHGNQPSIALVMLDVTASLTLQSLLLAIRYPIWHRRSPLMLSSEVKTGAYRHGKPSSTPKMISS
jgi:hypothetical protein